MVFAADDLQQHTDWDAAKAKATNAVVDRVSILLKDRPEVLAAQAFASAFDARCLRPESSNQVAI